MLSLASVVGSSTLPDTAANGSWFALEPPIAAGVIGATALYFYLIGPFRRRFQPGNPIKRRQIAMFLLAMTIIFTTLQGPLAILSDGYLLSAHMLQHLLLTLVMPPLLLKGIPGWLIDRVLLAPLFLRRTVRRRVSPRIAGGFPRGPLLQRVGQLVTSPMLAFAPFNVVFLLWHVPAFYEATLTNSLVHSLMHTMFISAAILTWWPVFSPSAQLPALSDPLQLLYLFFQSIPSTVLGAIITLADVVLYPTYASAPRVIALSPRADQQTAGLMMWFGGAAVILTLITIRWFRWMDNDVEESLEVA